MASRRCGHGRRRSRPRLNADRKAELAEDAEGLDPRRARRAAELVMGHAAAPERERFGGTGRRSARVQDGSRSAGLINRLQTAQERVHSLLWRGLPNLGSGGGTRSGSASIWRSPSRAWRSSPPASSICSFPRAATRRPTSASTSSPRPDDRPCQRGRGRQRRQAQDAIDVAAQEDFSAWVYDASGNLITNAISQGFAVDDVEDGGRGATAQRGRTSSSPSPAARP